MNRTLALIDAFVLGGLCEAPALTCLLARIRGPGGGIELLAEEGRVSESGSTSLNNSQTENDAREASMMGSEVGIQTVVPPPTPSARREVGYHVMPP